MPKFAVEVYELHLAVYTVHAKTKEEAIRKVQNGGGNDSEEGIEYVEVATQYSVPIDGVRYAGIRGVEEIE